MSGSEERPNRHNFRVLPKDGDDVSTGDEFQDKVEDDLYEKKEEKEDAVSMWAGRICIVALSLALIYGLLVGCVALTKWVF